MQIDHDKLHVWASAGDGFKCTKCGSTSPDDNNSPCIASLPEGGDSLADLTAPKVEEPKVEEPKVEELTEGQKQMLADGAPLAAFVSTEVRKAEHAKAGPATVVAPVPARKVHAPPPAELEASPTNKTNKRRGAGAKEKETPPTPEPSTAKPVKAPRKPRSKVAAPSPEECLKICFGVAKENRWGAIFRAAGQNVAKGRAMINVMLEAKLIEQPERGLYRVVEKGGKKKK
jgi:hypothetical protein